MNLLKEKIDQTIENIPDFPSEGIQYKDISPLFLDPVLSREIIQGFTEKAKGKVDLVCGIESRGFLYGVQIAHELNIPFVMIRKAGKLPPPIVAQTYELEYGSATIELKENVIQPGMRVMIHDDVLATGGTAEAAAWLVEKCGGVVTQFSFIAALNYLEGEKKLKSFTEDTVCLTSY